MQDPINRTPFDALATLGGADAGSVEAVLRRVEAFLDALPDDAWMKDVEGRYVLVNEHFADTLGLPRTDLIGVTDEDLFDDPDAAASFHATDRLAVVRGQRITKEHWGAGPQDADRRYETIKAPVRGDDGEIIGTVGIARDVTERVEREARLRTAEQRYRRLAETSPDGVFVTDVGGTLVEVNEALCRILGRDAEDILGHSFLEFVAVRSQEAVMERFRTRVERGASRMELLIVRPDGEERRVEARTNRIREDGEFAGTHGVARDVTEARRREEAERRMVDVLEATPDIVVIRDADGDLLYANGTARSWGAEDRDPGWEYILAEAHPDWADELVGEVGIPTALEEGAWTGETALVRPDGAEVPISQVIVAGRDEDDEVLHISTIMRDISAIRAREEALRRRDAILEAVSRAGTEFLRASNWEEGSDRGLAMLGEATGVSRLSVLRLDGQPDGAYHATLVDEWTAEGVPAMLGDPMLQDVPAETVGMTRWVQELLADRAVYGPVSEMPADEQEILQAQDIRSVAAVPVHVQDALWGMIVFDDCVTARQWVPTEIEALRAAAGALSGAIQRRQTEQELAEREEELRQSQKMEAVGRLAGGVAHDFNNMLTAIQGFATLARSEIVANERGEKYLDEILRAADRSASLTRQLLAFSRKQVMRPQVIDLNAVVSDMEVMLHRLLGETIELETSLAEGLHPVKVDPGQMEQVLMNLSVNAKDAMPDGGTLRIRTRNRTVNGAGIPTHEGELPPGDYVEISVEDSGMGLDPAVRDRIFEPFFTTKDTGEGTGLGLSTVYGIVNQSDGEIAVETAIGEGTTFRIYVPRSESDTEAADATGTVTADPRADHSGTILVVEDETAVRRLIEDILCKAGFTVIPASTGVEAIARLRQHPDPVDLLLTDVVMPEMGGPKLVEILEQDHPELQVCFMSGYTEDEVFRRGVQVRDETFLEKPFSPAELRDRVTRILAGASDDASPS